MMAKWQSECLEQLCEFCRGDDERGGWLSCRAASPVWEFLGKEGLPKGDFPDNYDRSCIGASLGYVRRGGQHELSGYDWLWMLDFADQIVKSQVPTSFANGIEIEKVK